MKMRTSKKNWRSTMNLNELAKEICRREVGKEEVSIAQVKEILKHLGDIELEEFIRKNDVTLEELSINLVRAETPVVKLMNKAIKRAMKGVKKK